MQHVERIYKDRPSTSKLDLSFMHFDEIDSMMGQLYKFKKLDTLILAANRMRSLPEDMSILKHVKMLDISHNAFVDRDQLYNS